MKRKYTKKSKLVKFLESFSSFFKAKEEITEVTVKHLVEEEGFKYLSRNLVKINKAMSDFAVLTLNSSNDIHTVIIKLKVRN